MTDIECRTLSVCRTVFPDTQPGGVSEFFGFVSDLMADYGPDVRVHFPGETAEEILLEELFRRNHLNRPLLIPHL